MRIILEAEDLNAIANEVVRKINPTLEKVLESINSLKALQLEAINKQTEKVMAVKVVGEIVRRKELCQITGLSAATLWRLEREGDFPSRIHLAAKSVGWRRSEVELWLATRPK